MTNLRQRGGTKLRPQPQSAPVVPSPCIIPLKTRGPELTRVPLQQRLILPYPPSFTPDDRLPLPLRRLFRGFRPMHPFPIFPHIPSRSGISSCPRSRPSPSPSSKSSPTARRSRSGRRAIGVIVVRRGLLGHLGVVCVGRGDKSRSGWACGGGVACGSVVRRGSRGSCGLSGVVLRRSTRRRQRV